jgi:hypothetical protein
VFPDPPYRSESSGAPETRFERLVKEQHIVEAARCIIMFVAGDYECLKRMVREELNQAVIGLSGVLVNPFEASRSTNESLRTDTVLASFRGLNENRVIGRVHARTPDHQSRRGEH